MPTSSLYAKKKDDDSDRRDDGRWKNDRKTNSGDRQTSPLEDRKDAFQRREGCVSEALH